jgi:hypothetical protein
MHDELVVDPDTFAIPAAHYLQDEFNGWRILATMEEVPPGLDAWSRRNLDELAELEIHWPQASVGHTLLHIDIRSDNILLTENQAIFVDWAHAAIGCPPLDVVVWAPSVTLEGGPEPEELLARHGPSRDAEPEAITSLVAAFAGFLTEHQHRPSPPGLPTVRAFQAAQGEVARAWLQRRTGW